MKISIIIPSYNSEKTIEDCLSSLQNQNYSPTPQILVVDSSLDRTAEIVRDIFPEVTLVHLLKKTDPGTARNLGINKANGELLIFIDSDCIAPKLWIHNMVQGHKKHPNIAALGGAVRPSSMNPISFASYMAEFREFIPERRKKETYHIPTLNISYKKWVFTRHGRFNPHFYPQEDLLFNYRMTSQGDKILFDPKIIVIHQFKEHFKNFLDHQRKIGTITAQVLKIVPLAGYQIARNPILFFIICPLLPMIKFVRTLIVFLRYQRKVLLKNFSAIFVLKLGLVCWIYGFARGVLIKNSELPWGP